MDLTGNIHVIGKNGTGKSSILRAILFFYSAHTEGLGLKANQSSFINFYFPHPNSWLVYEVQGNQGLFTVAACRQSSRISFRFVNGAYEREMFMDQEGLVFTHTELLSQIKTRGLHHSPSIDAYEEYRSIIYGTISGAGKTDFRKYALFEADKHDNVWRTISNIFLNAGLESLFIKQTLIESISDKAFNIDLKLIQKELDAFSHNRRDIDTYRRLINKPDRILQLVEQHKELEKKKEQLAEDLAKSRNASLTSQKQTESKIQSLLKQLGQEEQTAQALELEQQSEITALNKQLGVLEHHLSTATYYQSHYENINISTIISALAKKPGLERELENRQAEYQVLTSEFANIEQEFGIRIEALEQERSQLQLDLTQQKTEKEQLAAKGKEQLNNDIDKQLQEIRTQSLEKQHRIRAEWTSANSQFQELKIQEIHLQTREFLETEISQLKESLAETAQSPNQLHSQIALAKEQVKHLDLQESYELKQLDADKSLKQKQVQEEVAVRENRIQTIHTQIEQSQTAFIGWLSGRYPDWEKNIGKVCREEVLFHPYLNPGIERLNELLFGVHIDLEELEVAVPSVDSLHQEAQTLQEQVNGLQKEWITFVQNWEKKKRNCDKRYRQKRKKIAKDIRQHENLLEQLSLLQKKLRVKIDEQHLKAQQLKQQQLLALQYKLQAQKELMDTSMQRLQEEENKLEQLTHELKQQKQDRIHELKGSLDQELQHIQQEQQEALATIDARKELLLNEKVQALAGNGMNEQQLISLQTAISKLQTQLQDIQDQQETEILYKRDKIDYLDRMDSFQGSIRQLQEQISGLQEEFLRKRQQQTLIIEDIQTEISQAQQELIIYTEELKTFDAFSNSPLYKQISPLLSNITESQAVDSLPLLIQQLHAIDQESLINWETLRRQMTAYLGHFRSNNLFGFPNQLQDDQAYHSFADTILDFVDTQKIEEFEQKINQQYAQLVGKISEEVRALSSLEEEISKLIHRINTSFQESNFVGVVKEIQLKMEDSTNPVVTALKHLKQYQDDYGMQLGGPSLFSQSKHTETNKKAIDLLELLADNLKGYKGDQLRLEDSFQLAFRVLENQNDTGWVERLSNVGSNGTDVLVKAMIYITLLSVFKDGSAKKNQDFRLHCIIDEVGILDSSYLQDLISFANAKDISLINGSPNENNPLAYNHIYHVRRDEQDFVRVNRLISQVGNN